GLPVPRVRARDDDGAHRLLARHRVDAAAQRAELLRDERLRLQQRDAPLVALERGVGRLAPAPREQPPPGGASTARLGQRVEGRRRGRRVRPRQRGTLGRSLAGRAALALLFRPPPRVVDLGHSTSPSPPPGCAPRSPRPARPAPPRGPAAAGPPWRGGGGGGGGSRGAGRSPRSPATSRIAPASSWACWREYPSSSAPSQTTFTSRGTPSVTAWISRRAERWKMPLPV